MAKKTTNIAAALAASKEEPPAKTSTPRAAPAKSMPTTRKSSREGQVNISAWFDAPVKYALEELRLERQKALGRRVTLQEIAAEAYNDLFKKYGMPEVAPTKGQG